MGRNTRAEAGDDVVGDESEREVHVRHTFLESDGGMLQRPVMVRVRACVCVCVIYQKDLFIVTSFDFLLFTLFLFSISHRNRSHDERLCPCLFPLLFAPCRTGLYYRDFSSFVLSRASSC